MAIQTDLSGFGAICRGIYAPVMLQLARLYLAEGSPDVVCANPAER